jgi:hypothetical protein
MANWKHDRSFPPNEPPRPFHWKMLKNVHTQDSIVSMCVNSGRGVDAVLSSCCSVAVMKALILLAKGKRPEAVLDVEVIPAVGAQIAVAGTVYEVIGIGHAFDLDAAREIVHTVEIEVRILSEARPS